MFWELKTVFAGLPFFSCRHDDCGVELGESLLLWKILQLAAIAVGELAGKRGYIYTSKIRMIRPILSIKANWQRRACVHAIQFSYHFKMHQSCLLSQKLH